MLLVVYMYVHRESDKVVSNLSKFCGKPTQPNLSKEEVAMLHGYLNKELTDVGLLAYPYLSLEKRHTCRIVTTMTKQRGTKRNNSCVTIRNKDKLQYGLLHKLLLVSHGSEEYYLAVITNLHPAGIALATDELNSSFSNHFIALQAPRYMYTHLVCTVGPTSQALIDSF